MDICLCLMTRDRQRSAQIYHLDSADIVHRLSKDRLGRESTLCASRLAMGVNRKYSKVKANVQTAADYTLLKPIFWFLF